MSLSRLGMYKESQVAQPWRRLMSAACPSLRKLSRTGPQDPQRLQTPYCFLFKLSSLWSPFQVCIAYCILSSDKIHLVYIKRGKTPERNTHLKYVTTPDNGYDTDGRPWALHQTIHLSTGRSHLRMIMNFFLLFCWLAVLGIVSCFWY